MMCWQRCRMSHKKEFTEDEKKEIIKRYTDEKISAKRLGEMYGTTAPTILKNLKEWGIGPNSLAYDLEGKEFGDLTVLHPAKHRDDKHKRWVCKCSCGKIAEVRTEYLINGHTTSCGHTKEKYFGQSNIVGKKFGRLTVISKSKAGKRMCRCDCGKVVGVYTGNLTNGNTMSCGCYQRDRASEASFIDLTGKRFGKLVVKERVKNDRYNHVNYLCVCDCGGTTITDAARLRSGSTSSCGCIKSKGEAIINKWLNENGINFKPQYSHDDMFFSTGRRPMFDFAIFDSSGKNLVCLVEYNGKFHYETAKGWSDFHNLVDVRRRDLEKQILCIKHSIPLIIIPYTEVHRLDEIMQAIVDVYVTKEYYIDHQGICEDVSKKPELTN